MISNEIDEKKTKYFVIAIILLILLSIFLVIHFNNKSLVSGEEEKNNTTTKTTTTITTTTTKVKKKVNVKKEEVVELENEVVEPVVYKSEVDKENKLVYSYKLTDEITETDKIVSTVLEIDETLKENNVIVLYDISLYDNNMVKKSVKNSLIEISIPLNKDMLGYVEYDIVYIDDKNNITDEEFDSEVKDNYIKFTTNHLSKFGIIATKKEVVDEEPNEEIEEVVVDLTNVQLDLMINEKVVTENNLYVKTSDKVGINVVGLDENVEHKLYYLLQDKENKNIYLEFNSDMFKDITTPSTYKLFVKLEVNNVTKSFELATVNVYDEVFIYDKNEEITEDIIIGEIKDDDGNESTYLDKDTNMNIVIDNVTVEEEIEETPAVEIETPEVLPEENLGTDETLEEDTTEENTPVEDLAKIVLKGNIYLVEETDISELEMTGHLIIDTKENITFKENEGLIDSSNLYTIYIKSQLFSINGVNYKYEIKNGLIVITKIAELETDNEVITKEEFENLFEGFEYNEGYNDLILEKKPVEVTPEVETPEIEAEENTNNTGEELEETITK